jgi:hypothetical protein
VPQNVIATPDSDESYILMKVACLINTYTSAKQIQKFVQKLSNGQFDFYIHVDKKLDLETYKLLFERFPNVYFVKKRVDVKWGSITSVEATINGLKLIEATGIKYDFINFMSGQDYPIKSADYILNFLKQNIGKEFIHYKNFEDWPGVEKRLNKYFLTDLRFRGNFRVQGLLNSIIKRRKAPKNITIYGFSTFWTLSHDCAMYMVKYLEENPLFKRFFKYTFGSDELIYQTIIMNSPYKDAVINNNYRYVDWSEGNDRPKFLRTEDFDKIIASDRIFGRKFNIDIDENILNMIDNYNAQHPL